MPPFDCRAVVVTHRSEAYLRPLMESLAAQTVPLTTLYVIDSGSPDTAYLDKLVAEDWPFVVSLSKYENIGFCKANNLALALGEADYWLFINPDAMIEASWLEQTLEFFSRSSERETGVVSSPLLGFDIKEMKATGRYDSCGIERTSWGRWYDRGQGELISSVDLGDQPYAPTAICGALLFVRSEVTRTLISDDGCFFDENLFMYKDDIDLSLRIKQKGWSLKMLPHLKAYHCRGWNSERSKMPKWQRRLSARNEVRVATKHPSPFLPLYILKYFYVRFLEDWILNR